MDTTQFVFTDRYQAMGLPYPDPTTVCEGHCEGTGFVPVKKPQSYTEVVSMDDLIKETQFQKAWEEQHNKNCNPLGIARSLFQHRELWFWRSIGRNVWNWLTGYGYCDGWHFVTCPNCTGSGKRV